MRKSYTLIELKRTWVIGRSFEGKLYFVLTLRLKFVTSPVVKQVPGVGRMTAQLRQLKFQFLFCFFFTSNHTQSAFEPR